MFKAFTHKKWEFLKLFINQGIDIFYTSEDRLEKPFEYFMRFSDGQFGLFDVLIETGVYKKLKTNNKLLSLIQDDHNGNVLISLFAFLL